MQSCVRCPRLREYCLEVANLKRKAYRIETYWGRPVSGFGDLQARLGIVGLAPSAHGANRTGRIFTGDRSGEWLYRALYRAGFSNQPKSVGPDDGLQLQAAYVTCLVKCAPPKNRPSSLEIQNCSIHLEHELKSLTQVQVWLALGQLAFNHLADYFEVRASFRHGLIVPVSSKNSSTKANRWLVSSYHPSQQNTFTGRLTEEMFDTIFKEINKLLKE